MSYGSAPPVYRMVADSAAPVDLVSRSLERIAQRDSEVHAFCYVNAEKALAQARLLRQNSSGSGRGPLHGIPIGVKDIIDTNDMPTRLGSPIYKTRQPVEDASCVAMLKAAGAIVVGKTHTTEFAFRQPGVTKNPHNLKHTAGASSQGSAAAVSAGMVPLALSTQTAASTIRPAAYCGVVGYKATAGDLPYAGVMDLSPNMDSLGVICHHVSDAAVVRSVLTGESMPSFETASVRGLTFALVRTHHWSSAEEATHRAVLAVADNLSNDGAQVVEPEPPAWLASLEEVHATILAYEAARARAPEFLGHPASLSKEFQDLMKLGTSIPYSRYFRAVQEQEQARAAYADFCKPFDAVLAPSAAGEAPAGYSDIGGSEFSRCWTALRVPCVTLPVTSGARGLPIGIQLVGKERRDMQLLGVADCVLRRVSA